MSHNSNNPDAAQDDADWEEWDGSSPFWVHCVAGSVAGVVEHVAVYPLDTVRTHIQVCAACLSSPAAVGPKRVASIPKQTLRATTRASVAAGGRILPTGMWQTMRFLMNEPTATTTAFHLSSSAATTSNTASFPNQRSALQGMARLWRGVEAILVGCIPAHALYFSAYEVVKAATRDGHTGEVTAWGSSLAGAAAVLGHDVIMTPLDTVKQRMQLGHYAQGGVQQACSHIYRTEGWHALYRSLPITLLSNVPYGMIMVTTNELCKATILHHQQEFGYRLNSWQTVLVASSMGGFTAAALTTPLDRIKTALQTQALAPACLRQIEDCPKQQKRTMRTTAAPRYTTFLQAARGIYQHEGLAGFARGWLPRVLSHTPAVAISWTTYEMTKQTLVGIYNGG